MDDLANGISLPQHRGFLSPRPYFDSLEPSQKWDNIPFFGTRRAFRTPVGVPQQGPSMVLTDNMANARVGSGDGYSTRSRHFLRRYHAFLQRVRGEELVLKQAAGDELAVDALTKFEKSFRARRPRHAESPE